MPEAPRTQLGPNAASPTKPALVSFVPSQHQQPPVSKRTEGEQTCCPDLSLSHLTNAHPTALHFPFLLSYPYDSRFDLSSSPLRDPLVLRYLMPPLLLPSKTRASCCLQSPAPTSTTKLLFSHKNPSQMPSPSVPLSLIALRRVVTLPHPPTPAVPETLNRLPPRHLPCC